MAIYGAFSAVTLGLLGQSHAINTIGTNIANVNTGGYKRTDTQFQTVLSRALFEQSDLGGIKPLDVQRVDVQGQLVGTANDLDLAINGDGFFIVSPTITPGNELFYTRDGAFQVRVGTNASGAPTNEGYIADKNGFYLLGWVPNATTGAFPSSGAGGLQALRVDTAFFANTFQATTEVDIGLNLPAENAIISNHATAVASFESGSTPTGFEHYEFFVIDSLGTRQTVRLNFTKSADNTWQVSATTQRTAVAQVDTVTLAGTIEAGDQYSVTISGTTFTRTATAADTLTTIRDALVTQINNNTTLPVTASAGGTGVITLTADTAGSAFTSSASATNGGVIANNTATAVNTTANVTSTVTTAASTLTFNSKGTFTTTPTPLNFSISTFPGGGAATFTVDVSRVTQFSGGFLPNFIDTNGFAKSNLTGLHWESDGRLVGVFDNEFDRALYKIPVAIFPSPNNLEAKSGNVFAETQASGTSTVTAVDATGAAEFAPSTVELSNVALEDQFTRMIQAQAVYNASATAFKTVDEMTVVARDLKA
jgi:flagellar hook protein FlgE